MQNDAKNIISVYFKIQGLGFLILCIKSSMIGGVYIEVVERIWLTSAYLLTISIPMGVAGMFIVMLYNNIRDKFFVSKRIYMIFFDWIYDKCYDVSNNTIRGLEFIGGVMVGFVVISDMPLKDIFSWASLIKGAIALFIYLFYMFVKDVYEKYVKEKYFSKKEKKVPSNIKEIEELYYQLGKAKTAGDNIEVERLQKLIKEAEKI